MAANKCSGCPDKMDNKVNHKNSLTTTVLACMGSVIHCDNSHLLGGSVTTSSPSIDGWSLSSTPQSIKLKSKNSLNQHDARLRIICLINN